jgi:hypothetical protein
MTKIVYPWPSAISRSAQSDLVRDAPELSIHGTNSKCCPATGNEQVLRDYVGAALCEEPIAMSSVSTQRSKHRWVQRNQSRLPELRLSDCEDALFPIDVLISQIPDFTEAHSGNG